MRTSKKSKIKRMWPLGTRVAVTGGNLYALGRVTGYGLEDGEPWVTTDAGDQWSAFDVNMRVPTDVDLKYFSGRRECHET